MEILHIVSDTGVLVGCHGMFMLHESHLFATLRAPEQDVAENEDDDEDEEASSLANGVVTD